MAKVACSLVLPYWELVAFSPYVKFVTALGEGALNLCYMSHILFGVGATSSPEPVMVTSTPLERSADD